MITGSFTTWTDIQGASLQVEVEFAYHPAHKGRRDSIAGVRGAGPPLEPDEPAYIEVIVKEAGTDNDITDLVDDPADLHALAKEMVLDAFDAD